MADFALDIQLSLLCPAEGAVMIGLTLSTQLPIPNSVGLYPHWFPKACLVNKSIFETLPAQTFKEDLTPRANSLQKDANHKDVFLSFVDKLHENAADGFCAIVQKANEGVANFAPLLCEQGEGGTYFLRDIEGVKIAVFKPADEDPQGVNNPKKKPTDESHSPRVLRKTIPKGEAALREVAAYELDKGFTGIPPTRMMNAKRSAFNDKTPCELATAEEFKTGSLQIFVDSEGESWDIAPYKFSTADIHKIGIFDIRSFNTDRHGGNILTVARDEPKDGGIFYDLVPIDHGFCFPTDLSEANWEWLYWPQAKKSFAQETLSFIAGIDIDEDSKLLRRLGLSEEAVRVNRMATLLLKHGAAAGLTLFEIAKLCMRKRFRGQEEPSPLEQVCSEAEVAASGDMVAFWANFELTLPALVAQPATSRPGRSITL